MDKPLPAPSRVLLVGASGTLGRAVAGELSARHDLLSAGRNSGELRLDLTDSDSIRAALAQAGPLDAVVCAAGNVHFAPLLQIGAAGWQVGLDDKLMGQVNLSLLAAEYLREGGSITLTGGVLADQPIRQGASASLVNGALEAFVRAAAIELPRGLRINLVSPTVLLEAMPAYAPYFRGFEPVPAARAALAYARSVEGAETGKVYRVH
ncbi:MAG: short chain dehydrogenase [Lysobacterales bacterium 69-70]|nr:short chain dehydrogenase [Xanthomonadaceae bacterium]ODU30855.1 MAG: short chain dehydrogenase [Xanthomonadaceae bacterium SCN 69-320]ODV22184.1 MAG: short chain dehydrogenase [Xanthomonadaceae bacterium SCN 69-25]OJY98445.1 MAG: short chain dehydrogenase [Xanthomonadales bacterium 69-70]